MKKTSLKLHWSGIPPVPRSGTGCGIIFFIFLFFMATLAQAQTETRKVTPPRKIEYEDKTLTYNPTWKDQETYIEANIDSDTDKEIIISFVASYKPVKDVVSDKAQTPFSVPKEEIPLIENHSFYQIYDLGLNGHYELIKTMTGMDRLGQVEIFSLDKNKPNAIAILSPGGERYTDLSIYQWSQGGYRLIFNQGTNQKIMIDKKEIPAVLHIGPQILSWNASTNTFKPLDKNLK